MLSLHDYKYIFSSNTSEKLYCVSFHLQISRFTEIILEKDTDEEYKYFRVEENPSRPTLLHLAAEQNFLHVTKLLVEKYPTLVYLETEVVGDYERGYLPVEKALMCYKDETAAYLISQMKHDWWVQATEATLYFRVKVWKKVQECLNYTPFWIISIFPVNFIFEILWGICFFGVRRRES